MGYTISTFNNALGQRLVSIDDGVNSPLIMPMNSLRVFIPKGQPDRVAIRNINTDEQTVDVSIKESDFDSPAGTAQQILDDLNDLIYEPLEVTVGTPEGIATEDKQDDEIAELEAIKDTLKSGGETYLKLTDIQNAILAGNPNWDLAIARGQVPGVELVQIDGILIGMNAAQIPNTIWDGRVPFTHDTAAQTYYLVCTDNSATQTVRVELLDSTWTRVTQDVALTGQTAVAIPGGTYRAVNSIRALSGTVSGNVFVTTTTTAPSGNPADATKRAAMLDYAAPAIGLSAKNKGKNAIYTVPAGYTLFIKEAYYSAQTLNLMSTKCGLLMWDNTLGFPTEIMELGVKHDANQTSYRPLQMAQIPEMQTVYAHALIGTSNNTTYTATINGYLIAN